MQLSGLLSFLATAMLLFATIFVLRKKERPAINPLVLFLGLWTLILFLSLFSLYDIERPSDFAYILLLIMVTCFTLGFAVISKWYKPKDKPAKETKFQLPSIKESLALKIIVGIAIAAVVLYVIDMTIGFKYILDGTPVWQVRNWTLEPFGSSNPILDRRTFIEDCFRAIIAAPVLTILIPIAALYFFSSKDKLTRRILLWLAIITTVILSLAGGGGRLGFICFVGYFILAYYFCKRQQILRPEIRIKRLLVACCAIIIPVVVLTVIRTDISNVFKQFYTYFAMPPTLLSKWLPVISGTSLTFGLTSLFGFHSYIFRGLKTAGLVALVPFVYEVAYQNILNAEVFVNIGGENNFNAFVTPVYYFMCDGGIVAVILGSLLFGAFSAFIYKKLIAYRTPLYFTMYALVQYSIFVSFMRIQYAIPDFIVSFIIVTILFGLIPKFAAKKSATKENKI